MENLILVKRSGLKLINTWKSGQNCVVAEDVEGVLAKKQAELMALRASFDQVNALLKRMISELEGVGS